MDRAMQLRHLGEAVRHIAEGERHISEQEDRIFRLSCLGADTAQAQRLLNNFFANQMLHLGHRDRLLRDLGRKSQEPFAKLDE